MYLTYYLKEKFINSITTNTFQKKIVDSSLLDSMMIIIKFKKYMSD